METVKITEQQKLKTTISLTEQLRGGAEKRLDIKDISVILNLITDSHAFLSIDINEETIFYRARILYDKQPISDLNLLVAKKHEDVKSYGRCNIPGKSILYASINIETILSELGVDVGQTVQYIAFKKKKNTAVKCTIISEIDHVRRYGKSSIGGQEFVDVIKKNLEQLSELERLKLHLVDAFISEKFRNVVKYPYEYKTTSLFSQIVFEQNFDAFYYPSVAHLGGFNIAITPDAFNDNFEIINSEVIIITDSMGYGMYANEIKFKSKEIKDGVITWLDNVDIRYPTFDLLIWHNLNDFSSPNTLLIQTLENDEKEINEFVKENYETLKSNQNSSHTILKAGINGSVPINADLDFNLINKHILSNTATWDVLVCKIIKTIDKDEINEELKKFSEDVQNSNTKYDMFNNKGNMVVVAESRIINSE